MTSEMMEWSLFLFAAVTSLFAIHCCYAFPMCLNQEAPLPLNTSLSFCSEFQRNDSSCCDSAKDDELQTKFQSFNVSDGSCSIYLKQLLCAECDPYAADLFQAQLKQDRSLPVLCNSTIPNNSNGTTSYCENIWKACSAVPITESPFATSLQGAIGSTVSSNESTRLADIWQSESDLCSSLGGPPVSGEFCYSGYKFVPFNMTTPLTPIEGICLEKISDQGYLSLIPHPDGSNRVFVTSQNGKIWLADLPMDGSGKPMEVNEPPYLDLSDRIASGGTYGLFGLAFHPNFKDNGRFFVSYDCDKNIWPDCSAQCACTNETNCDVSQLDSGGNKVPCQVAIIVSEYSANSSDSLSSTPLQSNVANPNEVRKIFKLAYPYDNHLGGQILFGPVDNYLYIMIGDGGSDGDPFNFSQNKRALLGKILRLDVDNFPSPIDMTPYGNYSIPSDNPFVQETDARAEIWAYGLRNPWRCNFDSFNPSYFYCGDAGQEKMEEVDLITKGGNYGWRVYEGTELYTPPRSPGGNTSASSIQPIFPILEYTHDSVNPSTGSAALMGGYVSRSTQDACLYGRYAYADLYAAAVWAAAEIPPGSGNYTTTKVKVACSPDSPLKCNKSSTSTEPNFNLIVSFGQDYANNLYILSFSGVYKVSDPRKCGFICNATVPVNAFIPFTHIYSVASPANAPDQSASSASLIDVNICFLGLAVFFFVRNAIY